jgi:endogenous inhibitor of DNA gyrase (YacG/DUF329 family)
MDPVVKEITCPSCGKPVNVRVIPSAAKHTFHCPHCKNIVTAA